MLRIGTTQRYHDPLIAGINDVQELSKTHEALSRVKSEIQHRILTHYLPLLLLLYGATIWMRSRIASPEMFLNAEPLPHVICSRRAKERRGNGEAIEHGNA